MENKNEAPVLNNYEVNKYVISMALEVAKINRVDFQQACDQVRTELRKEAFTGQEVAPNA